MADVLPQGRVTRMMAWMVAEPEKVIAEAAAPAASQLYLRVKTVKIRSTYIRCGEGVRIVH
jgi:hypothetical protein